VLGGAPEVDLALLALPHELLELLLELLVGAPAGLPWSRVLEGLDRQVDLAVVLDRGDLDLDAIPFAQVLADVLDVVRSISEMWTRPIRPSSSCRNAP